MGEAKRKARLAVARPWATGSIEIEANDQPCFKWAGTKGEAIELQKGYLRAVETWTTVSANSYAKRAAGYLMAFGMPSEGDPDRRPSNSGQTWTGEEIARLKAAVLWMVLHEHVPNKPGQRVEDVFVGKSLLAVLRGDKRQILADTARELNGEPFSNEAFTMTVGVLGDCRLDPAAAVTMIFCELRSMAGRPLEADDKLGSDLIYVPRIPHDAAEARSMLGMMTLLTDATNPAALADPEAALKIYAGFTDDELCRGKPAVRVSS